MNAIAIIIGSVTIAAAILFVERWEIVQLPTAGLGRVDHWTGTITACANISKTENSFQIRCD
jgi:hypothetical protein